MPTFFQRPENALKRAKELIGVGKKDRALDALYDVIKSKKHRTWQKIHEPIMDAYLELCVDLKKSHVAKEGLYQYKNICQQVNIKSLEDVVRRYLAMAEERTEAARKASHQAVVDVDDLDVIQTPENLLLSAVSGEDTQDRTDRAILTPWVKFLWESYRQCLDLLRNNNSVEKLYQDIAQQAFKFCLNYTRKTEFRKLCDNLRTHLGHIHKHQHQQRAINLNNPDSQAMHLETRLVQLDSAIQMELWQEAFKAVEDIHGLIALSKKPPKPSLMANYYQKLGLVFWKSGNHMFHACAWHRLLHLSREQRKNLSQDELQKLASRVLCATLSIPIPSPHDNNLGKLVDLDENTTDKRRRLATLLGMQSLPNRTQLVKDLGKYNVVQHVHPELQNLYNWLEVEFHPLKLSNRVQASIEFINQKDELAQYASALEDITITRLIKQVSQVYQTIEFDRLAKMVSFATPFRLERVVVDSAKCLELQVRIDHRTRSLSFGTDLAMAQKEDTPEGPYLQSMPSEQIRNQLTQMAQALNKAKKLISPNVKDEKHEELKAHIIQSYRQTAKKDHVRILHRRQIIEERKEEIENLNNQREREELEQIEDQRRKQVEAEMARLEREAEQRERQRQLEEHKSIQQKMARERLEQLKSTPLGSKVFANLEESEIAEMDMDDILAKQVEQLEKEKKELQEKLKSQEKKVDYFERAKRLEEIPLMEKKYEEDQMKEKEYWLLQEKERIEQMKVERGVALEHRDRLTRITKDKDEFLAKLSVSRMSVYKNKASDFEKKLVEEKKKRMEDRKKKRKEERRQKYYKEKEEEEQRKRDEELKRQREEEERLAMERREEEEREYNERMAQLEQMEEKKREREREIEQREAMDRHRPPLDRDESSGGSGAWRPPRSEGGWRERLKAKEDSWKRPSMDDDKPRDDNREERVPPRDDRDERPREDRYRPPASQDRDRDRFPPRDEGRDEFRRDDRDRQPPRDDWRRDGGDRDRQPREDGERAWRKPDSDRPPPRNLDDDRGAWRGRDPPRDRDPPPRDRDDRDRPPPRDDRDRWRDGPPREDGWRDKRSDDGDTWRRGPPRDDRRDDRDDRGGGGAWRDRDFGRDRGSRDDGGAWRRRDDDRGPRDDRSFRDDRGPRDDRSFRDDRGPRDDRGYRDDRGPRDDRGYRDDRGQRDDRGYRDDRGPRDDRGFRDDRGPRDDAWRRRGDDRGPRDDRAPEGDGGSWRKPRDDDRGPPREERPPPPPREDAWRRPDTKTSPVKPHEERREEPKRDEGWTTVRR